VPSFLAAATVHMIETSAPLRAIQQKTLGSNLAEPRHEPAPLSLGERGQRARPHDGPCRRPATARKSFWRTGQGDFSSGAGPHARDPHRRGGTLRCREECNRARGDRAGAGGGGIVIATSSWMHSRSGSWCGPRGVARARGGGRCAGTCGLASGRGERRNDAPADASPGAIVELRTGEDELLAQLAGRG
jgi:hypothetical protein